MAYLKQHRKATLELEGRKLMGTFNVSLSNAGDREELMGFINEVRKQIRLFDKAAAEKAAPKKKKKKVARRRR